MSRCSQLKILFCIKILLALINAIVSHEDIFKHMSLEERRSFFENEDGSVPEFQLVELTKPARSKRAAQDPIDITFNAFGTISTATLNVIENKLITKNLTGIWFAETNMNAYQNITYTPKPDVFDYVGDIDLLQNPDDGSAIARFRNKNGDETILGVLKQNYSVKSVPRKFEYLFVNIHRIHAGRKRSTSSKSQRESSQLLVIFKNPEIPKELLRIRSHAQDSVRPEIERHRRKRQNAQPSGVVPSVVYPKLLICPDYGLMLRYWFIEDFIKKMIAQVNAVDMMFRQLKGPEVRLNIAGIIIPRDFQALPYIVWNTDVNSYTLNADGVLYSAQIHFYNEKRRFPHDSYDVVFIMTSMSIYALNATTGTTFPIDGLGRGESGCDGGPAIAKFDEGIVGVHLIAHELGHVFGVHHDEEGAAVICPRSDGYTMVPGSDLAQILAWSPCSRLGFKTFFWSNQGNCTYDPPEEVEIRAQEMIGSWLPMDGQCDNYFNDSQGSCTDETTDSCSDYGCFRNGTCFWMNTSPMEGSLHVNGTRCIGQKWQSK